MESESLHVWNHNCKISQILIFGVYMEMGESFYTQATIGSMLFIKFNDIRVDCI